VVLTPNGKTLIVHSFTGIVEYYPQIKQFKITQEVREAIVFEYITDDFFTFSTFSTAFFWGIGLAFHALNVFAKDIMFGRNWEEKKIKEYMDEEKKKGWE
jgi:hypothetical protein